MFEEIRELWKGYRISHSEDWPPPDIRADLAAEVENRLEQLDLLLDFLDRAIAATRSDPETSRRETEEFLREATRYQRGELTEEEYRAFIMSRPMQVVPRRVWSEIRLFTEAFYFFAWRIHEILDAVGPRALPGIGRFSASGIRTVRNLLLEHPEHGDEPLYIQSLVVTDDGPVLKTTSFMIKSNRSVADPESVDRGLFRNAEEFRDAMRRNITRAMTVKSGGSSSRRSHELPH
jgi:hypothetical protein